MWKPFLKCRKITERGAMQKVSIEGKRKLDEEEFVGDLEFLDIDYEDFAEEGEGKSSMGKITPDVGDMVKHNSEGYLIGPNLK